METHLPSPNFGSVYVDLLEGRQTIMDGHTILCGVICIYIYTHAYIHIANNMIDVTEHSGLVKFQWFNHTYTKIL